MKSYGQFCPVAKAAELFCEKWTPLIIRDLAAGATLFSELRRGVPLMSPALLSRRLKQLEAEGVVEARRKAKGRGFSYHLSEAGQEFVPLVQELGVWGQRWSRRELAESEIDLGLLLWTLERSVDPDAFDSACTTISLTFTDQPGGKDQWWFVNREGMCELCLEDPGYDVDLFLACDLPAMIHLVRGDISLSGALARGTLDVHGTAKARRRLRAWLNLGPLARVRPARSGP